VIDPTLPVLNLRTQDEQIDRLHSQERLFARLSGFFDVVLGLFAVALVASLVPARRASRLKPTIALRAE
jgi:ABC-type lipoprotein release transport system permease subunit